MADHERMPDMREGATRKFSIPHFVDLPDGTKAKAKLKFYVTANTYPDGRLGELFIKGDKMGSFVTGALDAFAIAMSIGLQHGVPLQVFVEKLRHLRFEPNGFIGDKEFTSCASAFDLLAQYLEKKFLHAGDTKSNGHTDNSQAK